MKNLNLLLSAAILVGPSTAAADELQRLSSTTHAALTVFRLQNGSLAAHPSKKLKAMFPDAVILQHRRGGGYFASRTVLAIPKAKLSNLRLWLGSSYPHQLDHRAEIEIYLKVGGNRKEAKLKMPLEAFAKDGGLVKQTSPLKLARKYGDAEVKQLAAFADARASFAGKVKLPGSGITFLKSLRGDRNTKQARTQAQSAPAKIKKAPKKMGRARARR